MVKALHKRIRNISLILMSLILLSVLIALIFSDTTITEMGPLSGIICCFCLLSIFTSWLNIHQEFTWIRKAAKRSLYIYPIIIVVFVPILMFVGNFPSFLKIPIIIISGTLVLYFTILFLLQIFLFTDATALTGNIIFISLIILWIYLKRYHILFSGVAITLINLLFSIGSFMYGIRCLYLAGKNRFLKYASFWCSCLITVTFIGFVCKVQHWPGGRILENIMYFLLIPGTLVVLLTLPSSGYFEWQPVHKKILKRLIIPWTLIFTLAIIRFLLPEVQKVIWNSTPKVNNYGFEMVDYGIENKNGLISE
jgi:hypothetical protein